MNADLPTILVFRRAQPQNGTWGSARSWLGAAPRLGGAAWPRDEQGEPLHFVAQIDLGEIAAHLVTAAFPADGALAFFIGRNGSAIHVPSAATPEPSRHARRGRPDPAPATRRGSRYGLGV